MNASNSRKLALPKPRPGKKCRPARKTLRTRITAMSPKRRAESRLVAKVFREIEPRDGDCALSKWQDLKIDGVLIGKCEGEPQPAHLPTWRRGTCKLPAAERSNRKTIARMCAKHHRALDTHQFDLEHHREIGADGPLVPMAYAKGAR